MHPDFVSSPKSCRVQVPGISSTVVSLGDCGPSVVILGAVHRRLLAFWGTQGKVSPLPAHRIILAYFQYRISITEEKSPWLGVTSFKGNQLMVRLNRSCPLLVLEAKLSFLMFSQFSVSRQRPRKQAWLVVLPAALQDWPKAVSFSSRAKVSGAAYVCVSPQLRLAVKMSLR